ncbi:uncharacterized protein [Primulina huaijiensis]|uniref:uncharacterized protein isoform X1 n=1 Tax=Primulina huaijiensis TaxID=1492673 RepID=UPI003CC6FFB7
MESSGGVDDQGSGWMQVKKKHRSSSKFIQSSGGLSGKQSSCNSGNRLLLAQRFENSNTITKHSSRSKDNVVHDVNKALNPSSIFAKDGAVDLYLDKRVVNQDNDVLDSSNLAAADVQQASYKLVVNQEHISKSGVLPKIKWGDLDEGTLVDYGKTSGSGIKFGGVENHYLPTVKAGSSGESLSYVASHDPTESKFIQAATDEDQVLPKPHSLSPTISIEENCKELSEMTSEDVKEQITCEKIVSPSTPISCVDREPQHIKQENDDICYPSENDILHSAGEEVEMRETANVTSETGCSLASASLGIGETIPTSEVLEIIELVIPGQSTLAASVEDSGEQKQQENGDDLLDTQNTNATGEIKERFRERLWGFLFENLNRAVDELYLLCELECDLDQMKEASLVLDEAASDFRELKFRVEKFEKLKRSSCPGTDGAASMLQSDHRRPHALSWEVRRMTTSPRRAEILSSSLEAFRKIQQDRKSERGKHGKKLGSDGHGHDLRSSDILEKCARKGDSKGFAVKARTGDPLISQASTKEKRNLVSGKPSEAEKLLHKKDKVLIEHTSEKKLRLTNIRGDTSTERDGNKRSGYSGKSLDAWKEKRNWEDLLSSPHCVSSRFSYSPGMGRKSAERVRVLHDKLMSPEKKKKSVLDLKKEAEEKHARATRIRTQLENERVQKLQRTSEKLNRVNEWQTVRSNKLRESMFARHQQTESRHEAYLAQVVRRAGDESSKVNEVRFITSLNEENKKHILRKKLQDSELRRAEKVQVMKTKQKEDMAREEAVLERRRLIEAEKLQRLAETQRRKEEALARREEERKASSAAREAKAMEQMRRKEVRAKAQQEEAELLAQKLAEKLSESEQRRKFYLEQIRERASMDFRDQSSPLLRRFTGKEGQALGRSIPHGNGEDNQENNSDRAADSCTFTNEASQHSLKRRIKRIRQRLMSMKHEFPEPSFGLESSGIAYRTAIGTARVKIGRWLQDLQKLRQARKDGASSFGLITAGMIKFLEGKDPELQASRQAGLLDFIASALPASHTSKPEACQVMIFLLRLLRIVLATPENKCYFLVQNLLPPIIPMLAAALESYIKMAASLSIPGSSNFVSSKTSIGNMEFISEVTNGFLWTVAAIIGFTSSNELQLQMQNGLVELVVAYQIIHRLRDLFALYDRPQVEGSPFPSSILLSINLLIVLTSKFRETSSIDWESFPSDVIDEHKIGRTEISECADLGFNLSHFSADNMPFLRSSSTICNLPDGKPLDETSTFKGTAVAILVDNNDSHNVRHISSKIENSGAMDEPSRIPADVKCECTVAQKYGNNFTSGSTDKNSLNASDSKYPAIFLLSAISETGLVCLPSMLTAVLLQANNRLSAEQSSYVLPSNFEEVATGILKVLNNLALIDVTFIQKMLARPDLKMEFFHLMSFFLAHCTNNWGAATDKIGSLLMESLSLLGYFALFHPENQAVLRWGKSPTILHKVCDLPFVFFSDPEFMPVLAGTLVAASYGCEQNKGVIQQELSMDMLLPLLESCRTNSTAFSFQNNDESGELNRTGSETKEVHQKSNRNHLKSTRVLSQRGSSGSMTRMIRGQKQRDSKVIKLSEELPHRGNGQSTSDASTLMLHCRFPVSFINKAEKFFTTEITSGELV